MGSVSRRAPTIFPCRTDEGQVTLNDSIRPVGILQFTQLRDAQTLAVALADHVALLLGEAVSARGAASLVVSGGSSPTAFFDALSQKELPWGAVFVTLADERWVDADSADSNEHLVRTHLLVGAASAARFVPLKTEAASPADSLGGTTLRLDALPTPFDVVVLGIGDDGHTASLFPDAKDLSAALDLDASPCVLAVVPPAAPYERITMNLACLLSSRQIVVLLLGKGKKSTFDAAIALASDASAAELGARRLAHPIAAVVHQTKVPVDVYWCP